MCGFMDGCFWWAINYMRTAREKNIAFPAKNGRISPDFILQLISLRIEGEGVDTGFACFGCGKRNTFLNPIVIASWSARSRFFGKPTPEGFLSPSPILDLPTRRTKKGRCL
jgi:hypothetical protein